MRYSLPQRKYVLQQYSSNLTKKLFPDQQVKYIANKIAPSSTIVFCHQKDHGYEGDDIGFDAKVCNSFFHTPSDVGMVLTKNLNINSLLKEDQNYETLFDASEQKYGDYIEGGTLWSKTTLVIDTNHARNLLYQVYPKKLDTDVNTVQLQIHQSKEFANMIMESDHDHLTNPLTLEAGKEYFIDVFPFGQVSTYDFKELSFHQRNCMLEQEVGKLEGFKIYTESNCKVAEYL